MFDDPVTTVDIHAIQMQAILCWMFLCIYHMSSFIVYNVLYDDIHSYVLSAVIIKMILMVVFLLFHLHQFFSLLELTTRGVATALHTLQWEGAPQARGPKSSKARKF